MGVARLTPWPRPAGPWQRELEEAFRRKGRSPRWGSDGPGGRPDLPPGTPHWALVGPQGVTCAEAARG
jgi:hypothetical protein